MSINKLIHQYLRKECPEIYETRLDALMDVAVALQKSNDLSLTRMGRELEGAGDIKHKIKKVDRLEGNKYLHGELHKIYKGLSKYVLQYLTQDKSLPIVLDLCFVKDDYDIQMLSAEAATKGRSIPLYREVFNKGSLKTKAKSFIDSVSSMIPKGREVVVIMDAGFFEDWYQAIEAVGWYWICRTRKGKSVKFSDSLDWISIEEFIGKVSKNTKNYSGVLLTKRHKHECRIITTTNKSIGKKRRRTLRGDKQRKVGSSRYLESAKEPWILATNLPESTHGVKVVNLYKKRMQIEESFRDMKSHQYGLCGRYIRTTDIYRWGVKMLLASIVQIMYWILGIIGHQQGMQKVFQANTVKDKKVFSNFTLGKFIIEYNKLDGLKIDYENLPFIIQKELENV